MDIVFKCTNPNCQTDLEVDAEAAGEEIECPACKTRLVIPQADASNAKQSSAPRQEKRFSVPVTDRPVEPLIKKALPPLEAAAREGIHGIRVRTIRHSDCKEVGHDKFDETVSEFLMKVGDTNVVSITPINYSYVDMGSQKLLTDFGVMIVYRV